MEKIRDYVRRMTGAFEEIVWCLNQIEVEISLFEDLISTNSPTKHMEKYKISSSNLTSKGLKRIGRNKAIATWKFPDSRAEKSYLSIGTGAKFKLKKEKI